MLKFEKILKVLTNWRSNLPTDNRQDAVGRYGAYKYWSCNMLYQNHEITFNRKNQDIHKLSEEEI